MEVLLNELSLHGQFASVQDFQIAIETVMSARSKMRQFGGVLRCHRNLSQAQVTFALSLQQAVSQFDENKRRIFMSWLTKEGPFWEDSRQHGADDYFESQNQIVTDNALGEAAYHRFNDNNYQTFSLIPSGWQINPITVNWHRNNDEDVPIDVINHWDVNSLEIALQATAPPITSWQQLAKDIPNHCPNLMFSQESFSYLYSHPFVDSAAKQIVERLKVLDKFKTCFDAQGQRTHEGQRLYQDHFTGDKAWFSDSSESEKIEFKNELTFKHPNNKNKKLFCPWHGKIKAQQQIRIHFSYPIYADEPLYVPYIGPKLTKK
jgi:hypothetical protein